MDHKGTHTYPFILLLALMPFSDAQSLSCPPITINDLGSTTTFSSNGLVARAIFPQEESASSVRVKIRNYTKVCDAAGDRINTSSFVSIVVEFQCDFQSSTASLDVCANSSTIVIRQYQFECRQIGWNTIVSGSNLYVQTLNPTATLSTLLVDTCRRCIDNVQSSRADPTTHCDRESRIDIIIILCTLLVNNYYHVSTACPTRCNQGQGRCYLGQATDVCCSFYFQDSCTEKCPSDLVNDSNSICGEFQ